MILEYLEQTAFTKSVDIVDEGNFALRCTSDNGFEYYIVVKTEMGKTAILKFGPTLPDIGIMCEDFMMTYKKINYKENIIEKEASSLMNDARKRITQVEEITDYEAIENIPSVSVENLLGD